MPSSRLLIRVPSSAARKLTREGFRAAGGGFELTPLFEVSPVTDRGPGVAAEESQQWLLAQTAAAPDAATGWDLAHSAAATLGIEAASLLVEPDLLQTWNPAAAASAGPALSAAPPCTFEDQRDAFPKGPGFAWHLSNGFSGLKAARDAVGTSNPVTIAHFDTGYDPSHVTLPLHLDTARQRNFVDPNRLNDATDPQAGGFLNNPGHGTATLGLLAGRHVPLLNNDPLGGAPHATVVPVRVANSVVQFFTSAIAQAFDYARQIGVDVISMSMGGVASSAWTDAVNAAYDAGIVMVCAAGNNFGGFPTRHIVYPARYRRVIAACGVMADLRPYFNLPINLMQGNVGPSSKMATAVSAFTPNVPWARIGCFALIDMDGQGTSAATPQVAAAAALWLSRHAPAYPEKWMRIEAARKALFASAAKTSPGLSPAELSDLLGNGILKAEKALAVVPALASSLQPTPPDRASFPFLRILTGLGLARNPAMLEVELTQLAQRIARLEDLIPDPDIPAAQIPARSRQRALEAILDSGHCSAALRDVLASNLPGASRPQAGAADPAAARNRQLAPPRPPHRPLRIFAIDPSLGTRLDTAFLNEATVEVPWEATPSSSNLLQPGPVGEYLEVVDIDPASGSAYPPVDLNQPFLLAQSGLPPSEGNPQFHQQMVYAVAMLTIRRFERALGRVALWSARFDQQEHYVQRLRIYPHALREANAYYSSDKKSLLFGYFPMLTADGETGAGGIVFTCLSHDIVAHETTHALLDGLHRRYQEPTNPDVLAFHEGFADIVAIFQHFTFPELLRHEIQAKGGDLTKGDLLADLARQFGEGMGRSKALRSAILVDPAKINYSNTAEPHDRGSILVAAVFDAFLAVYKRRITDLLRIATGGTGVLPAGALHPDLVNRLADEAAKAASHVLNICVRALDYCPPVDITFGSYLRALITADFDVVPNDSAGYRVAFLDAFRKRSIYPDGVRTLSVESLRWQEPVQQPPNFGEILERLTTDWDLFIDRRKAYENARANAIELHRWLTTPGNVSAAFAQSLGIDASGGLPLEVHAVRPARRVSPDGSFITDLVVVLTQQRQVPLDPKNKKSPAFTFRGGCTLLVDLHRNRIRYAITRSIFSESRLARQREYEQQQAGASLRSLYFGSEGREPFAMLHRGI